MECLGWGGKLSGDNMSEGGKSTGNGIHSRRLRHLSMAPPTALLHSGTYINQTLLQIVHILRDGFAAALRLRFCSQLDCSRWCLMTTNLARWMRASRVQAGWLSVRWSRMAKKSPETWRIAGSGCCDWNTSDNRRFTDLDFGNDERQTAVAEFWHADWHHQFLSSHRKARALRDGAVHLSVCLFVCLQSVTCNANFSLSRRPSDLL